jgi:hypothetical protein
MRCASTFLAFVLLAAAGPVRAAKPASKAPPPKAPAAAPAPASVPAPSTTADGKPLPKTGLSSILGTLDWGTGHDAVLAAVKAQIDERYAKAMEDIRDPLEIDRALRRKNAELAGVQKTYLRFTGERTGYESSLIAQDYVTDSEEAVLRIDDAAAQRYYFFKDDRLWKVLVAYNTSISRSVPFADFVKQVQSKYGRPADVDWYTPPGGARSIRSATWHDDVTQLVVEDRTEFFGTFVMKFLDVKSGVQLEAERAAQHQQKKPGVTDDPMVSSTLAEITSGGDAPTDGNDGVVDRLTGVQTDVNLDKGRPEYDLPIRGPIAGPTAETGDAKGKKGKKGRKGADDKAPEKQPDAKPAEPFIIY